MFSRASTAGSPPSSSPTPYSSQQSPAPNPEAENVLLAFPSSFAASCGPRTPRLCSDKETACQRRRCKGCGSIPGSGRSLLVGNDHPLQWFLSKNSMDRGAWWAMVHGVTKSETRLSTHVCTQTKSQPVIQGSIYCGVRVGRQRGSWKRFDPSGKTEMSLTTHCLTCFHWLLLSNKHT